jgi:RNA polymerase sigma factor (sigma-70 family)
MNGWEALFGTEVQTEAQTSFEEAFAAHHRLVYRYAYSLTRDTALAEDVAQEVFLRLHRQLDAAVRSGFLRAWLLRVTANVARNLMRSRSRAESRNEAFAAELPVQSAGPDQAYLREAQIAAAQAVLQRIKEPLRSCLLLSHEGLSYREIAEALGIRESSVGTYIARARSQFTKLYLKTGKER